MSLPAGLSLAGLFLLAGDAALAGVEVGGAAAAAAAALVVDEDLRVAESAEAAQSKTARWMQRGMVEDGLWFISRSDSIRLAQALQMEGSLALLALPPA